MAIPHTQLETHCVREGAGDKGKFRAERPSENAGGASGGSQRAFHHLRSGEDVEEDLIVRAPELQ